MENQQRVKPGSRYRIGAVELANTITGAIVPDNTPGISLIAGSRLDPNLYSGIPTGWIKKDMEYYLIEDGTIISNGAVFNLFNRTMDNKGLIFFNCIMPDIKFTNLALDSMLFVDGGCGSLTLLDKSRIDTIHFTEKARSETLMVSGGSTVGNLLFSGASSAGDIRILGPATVYTVEMLRSHCKSITISGGAKVSLVRCDNFSVCGEILIAGNSEVSELQVIRKSMAGDITVESGAILQNCEVGHQSLAGDIECNEKSTITKIHIQGICGSITFTENAGKSMLVSAHRSRTGSVFLEGATMERITIAGNCFGLSVTASSVQLLEIEDSLLSFLEWKIGASGDVFIKRSIILAFNLSNTTLTKDTVFSLSDTEVQYFLMEHLFIQGQLLLRRIGPVNEMFSWRGAAQFLPAIPEHTMEAEKEKREVEIDTLDFAQKLFDEYFFELLLKIYPPCRLAFHKRVESLRKIYKDNKSPAPGQYVADSIPETGDLIVTGDFDSDVKKIEQELLHLFYTKQSVFRTSHSSLGKTEITDSDLNGFRFEFFNTKLLDCFISGTQLSKNNIDIHIYNPSGIVTFEKEIVYEQKVSFYNQLKKIFENQGNIVETSWYHARAMENQQKLLKLFFRQQPGPWYKKIRSDRFFDLFAFWLNKQSNYHGESWGRALKFVLLTSFSVYALYYVSIHHSEDIAWSGAGDFIGDYFGFLDITHRLDFHVPKEQLSGLSKFLDYFGKVTIGYGLFQLVAAFRRHGKKTG